MRNKLTPIFCAVTFLFCFTGVHAQEVISNLQYNSQLVFKKPSNQLAAKRAGDTLQLPFFDDFANKDVYPKSELWLDSFVYVNDHFQKNAMSYGVATFDGLKPNGRPYNASTPNAYGNADTLTSKMIDLSSYPQTDTTIFFSFMYQLAGLGDWPNEEDSLMEDKAE